MGSTTECVLFDDLINYILDIEWSSYSLDGTSLLVSLRVLSHFATISKRHGVKLHVLMAKRAIADAAFPSEHTQNRLPLVRSREMLFALNRPGKLGVRCWMFDPLVAIGADAYSASARIYCEVGNKHCIYSFDGNKILSNVEYAQAGYRSLTTVYDRDRKQNDTADDSYLAFAARFIETLFPHSSTLESGVPMSFIPLKFED